MQTNSSASSLLYQNTPGTITVSAYYSPETCSTPTVSHTRLQNDICVISSIKRSQSQLIAAWDNMISGIINSLQETLPLDVSLLDLSGLAPPYWMQIQKSSWNNTPKRKFTSMVLPGVKKSRPFKTRAQLTSWSRIEWSQKMVRCGRVKKETLKQRIYSSKQSSDS